MVKLTFSLDEATADRLRTSAKRLARPQSVIVREAIREYTERLSNLEEAGRRRLVESLDELVARIPNRPAAEVDAEILAIRAARRRGGRHSSGR
jgi:predicted DNA-binding protein